MDQNPSEGNPRFSVNDLVWGKIQSHPWWPGQIYDPKHASEFAIKKQKNDHLLVAYFGDKTFAWVQESKLKHFEPYFDEIGNHTGLESFVKAVNDALSEYSRRVELGLVCNCVKDEILVGLKNRKVENTGVREDTCSDGVIVSEFLPSMFLEFIQACALFPFDRVGRLELARIVGQLKAFCGLKGNNELCSMCESTVYFMDDDSKVDVESSVKTEIKSWPCKAKEEVEENEKGGGISGANKGKRKNAWKVSDKSCFEVMPDSGEKDIKGDSTASKKKRGRPPKIREEVNKVKGSSSGEKVCKRKYIRKTSDNENHSATGSVKLGRRKKAKNDKDISEKSISESEELTEEEDSDQEESKLKVRKKKNLDGDSESGEFGRGKGVKRKKEILSPISATRAKLGDRIKQAAMKVKASLTGEGEDKDDVSAKDCSSPSEMLSQLHSLVLNPTTYSDIMPANIKFFTGFKNFISSMHKESKGGSKKKEVNGGSMPFELSEADYVQDSYWSDIVFDGSPKKEAASKEMEMEMEMGDKNVVGDSVKKTEMKDKTVVGNSVKKTDDETPTEFIMGFAEPDALPSISDLIGKLSAYGPLKEENTEILSTKKQAKVVFKHRVDAESAYAGAGNHSLFEAMPVSYRLRYSHKTSLATSPIIDNPAQINDGNLENRGQNGTGVKVVGT